MSNARPTVQPRLIAALLALAAVCYAALRLMWNHHPPDMSALYMAGRLWAEGDFGLIYAAPHGFFGSTPPAWLTRTEAWGMGGVTYAYIYPPLWAALLSPLAAAMDPATFFHGAAVIGVSLAAASTLLAWRLARSFAVPLWVWLLASAALMLTSLAFYMSVYLLQPQVIVIFLCLLAFERDAAGRRGTAGALLALAATMKLAPAGLVLIFLVERNWRALGAFAATCAAIGALGLAVAGWDLHAEYLARLPEAGAGIYVTSVNFSAEVLLYASGVLLGWLPDIDFAIRNIRITATPAWIDAAGKVAALAALVWMLRATAGLDTARRRVARLFLVSLLINLFGPLGWVHYFQLQVVLLPALAGLLPLRRGIAIAVFAAIATSWPLALWLSQVVPGDYFRAALGSASMLVLFVAVTLGCRTRSVPAPAIPPDPAVAATG